MWKEAGGEDSRGIEREIEGESEGGDMKLAGKRSQRCGRRLVEYW